MIRKDLKHIQLENQQEQDHTGISDAGVNTTEFVTAEGIELKQTYTSKRYRESKTSRFWAGFAQIYVDRAYCTFDDHGQGNMRVLQPKKVIMLL
jgi:hypothetical protein